MASQLDSGSNNNCLVGNIKNHSNHLNDTSNSGQLSVLEAEEFDFLLKEIQPLLVEYLKENEYTDTVWENLPPELLAKQLNLTLKNEGIKFSEFSKIIQDCLKYSVRTSHPLFLDKLYCGMNPVGAIGELVTAILNTNMHVYKVAPVFTLIEMQTIKVLGSMFFKNKDVDGLTCPGGSYSNMLAVLMARNTMFPETKEDGNGNYKFVIFTSSEGHYSLDKAANTMGIGSKNVIKIATDRIGRIIPSDLERLIKMSIANGKTPLLVNATAGTTVRGAFDPFEEIHAICEKYHLWMHIDASWGGGVIFSEKHRDLMKGCEFARSITWNPHKLLGAPLQTSILLVSSKGLMKPSASIGSNYLFHENSIYDSGDKTLQCGRRPDILKFFLMWKYYGNQSFENRVNLAFANVRTFLKMIQDDPDFEVVCVPTFVNICFRYIPNWLLEKRGSISIYEFNDLLSEYTILLGDTMTQRGKVLIDHTPHPDPEQPRIFRLVINSPKVQKVHLETIIREICEQGNSMKIKANFIQ